MRKTFPIFLLFVLFMGLTPVLAQDEEPPAAPTPTPLLIYTDYPAKVVGLNETISLDLNLRSGEAQSVDLSLADLPEEWTATFRGGGDIVQAVFVNPGAEAAVSLQLEPPADVAAGDYQFNVVAEGEQERSELPIVLTVQERVPASLLLQTELPTLRGQPDTSFRYNVTLRNEGDEELTADLIAMAPEGFLVTFQSGGQEVTSLPVGANESERLTIEAEPLLDVPAGTYPFTIEARGGDVSATLELVAEVVGRPAINFTTPDGRLSGQAEAGSETTVTLLLQNTGSAPARNISLSATPPNGWNVTFEPEEIPQIEAGQQVEVTARIQPAENAVAGDYVITYRARPEDSTAESLEYRVTVRTSTLWGIVGIGLIAVAVIVVGLAVSRFGRR